MINKKVEKAINGQIQAEFYSAYLYLSMSAYFESTNYKGFANWLKVQTQEELTHAMKFYNFLLDREGKVELQAIEQPPADFASPLEAFKAAHGHEKKVSKMIHGLYELARQEKDYPFEQFLHWFIEEQVEEEANALEVVEDLKKINNDSNGMLILDQKLGVRQFVDETTGDKGAN